MNLLSGFSGLFRGRARRDRELDEEIRAHLAMAVEDRVTRGEPREEAERAARREFGDPDRVKEITRAVWPGVWLDRVLHDLRFGVRSLMRDPAFACAAGIVLTIGIGANVAVFSLGHGILFAETPGISNSNELVAVRWLVSGAQGPERDDVWGYVDYAYVRAETTAFDGVLAYMARPIPVATSEQAGRQADAWVVSDNFFNVLGAEMAVGRGFTPEEGRSPGTHPVVVISNAFWQSRFAARPEIVGKTLPLNGTQFTIVGVAGADFRGISPIEASPDFYVPLMMQGTLIPGSDAWLERTRGESSSWLRLVARLREGTTVTGAQANLDAVQASWEAAFGAWWASLNRPAFRMVVTPDYKLDIESAERLRRMLGFLAVIVGAILVIGSANVAILLLTRGAARRGEIAVRAALGAGRARLFAQLVTENLIVALLGSVGGLAVALVAVRAVLPLLPYRIYWDLAPDAAVLAFVGLMMLAVTVFFGVAPSLGISRADVGLPTRLRPRDAGGNRLRNVLVVGQLVGAVVLIVGAGLGVRSLLAAQSVDPGFEPENRLVVSTDISADYDDERGLAFMNEVLARARSLPGVESATVAARAPFVGRSTEGVRVPGTRLADTGTIVNANWVGSDYFDTMGIPLVAGRAIEARDDDASTRVLVVSEATAERLWPGEDAVGRTIAWKGQVWTVVGVAADANYYALGEAPVSQMYVPMEQDFVPYLTFVLETQAPPETAMRAVQAVIRDLDPRLTISGMRRLQDLVDAQSSTYRLLGVTGAAFGVVALVLAVAGLYAVQSYLVRQRFREIGIRMALGAQSRQVTAGVLRYGLVLAAVGLGLGLPVASALERTVRGMLFGVQPGDPVTYVGVTAILMVTSLAASYFPARQAGRVAPMVVLRDE